MLMLRILGMVLILQAIPSPASAKGTISHSWRINSPVHGQTFAYGLEKRRYWRATEKGNLVLRMVFDNSPYVDRETLLQTDYFEFTFPRIALGIDQRTFYYTAPSGQKVPVAYIQSGLLGVKEVELYPQNELRVRIEHGLVTTQLIVNDRM